MIELRRDELRFAFPDVHPEAKLTIEFQRTLRIPDDGEDYPLPPGLGRFPLRHVDDFGRTVPGRWLEHGGVMLPMHQAEAMWLSFRPNHVAGRGHAYPFAVKVAAGKIDAVTGEGWSNALHRDPQDYMVVPGQPWLDGFCVEKGIIRQFVAMPLGTGYSAEEQLTAEAQHGGVQVIVYPMKREVFERRFPVRPPARRCRVGEMAELGDTGVCAAAPDMGLGAGGRMRQQIHDDPFAFRDWDRSEKSRCFVHLANSEAWRAIAGEAPPTRPPTAKDYTDAGLPWFEHYADGATAVGGSKRLATLKSVFQIGKKKGEAPLPENESVAPGHVIELRAGLKKHQVREGGF